MASRGRRRDCACWRSWSTTARAVSRPPRCSPTSPTPRMTGVSKRGRACDRGLQPAGGSGSGTGAGCSRIRPGDRVRGLRPVVWCARRGASSVKASVSFILGEGVDLALLEQARALEDPETQDRLNVTPSIMCAGMLMCIGDFAEARRLVAPVRRSRTAGHGGRDRRATRSCLHGVDGGAWRKSRAGVGLLGRCRARDVGAGERTHPSSRADAQRPRTGAAGEVDRAGDRGRSAHHRSAYQFARPIPWATTARAMLENRSAMPLRRGQLWRVAFQRSRSRAIRDPAALNFVPEAIQALVVLGDVARTPADGLEAQARSLDPGVGPGNGCSLPRPTCCGRGGLGRRR